MYEPGTKAGIYKRLRSPGIDSERLRRLAESIPWNWFLGSFNRYKLVLREQESDLFSKIKNAENNNFKFQAQECKQKVLNKNKESRDQKCRNWETQRPERKNHCDLSILNYIHCMQRVSLNKKKITKRK